MAVEGRDDRDAIGRGLLGAPVAAAAADSSCTNAVSGGNDSSPSPSPSRVDYVEVVTPKKKRKDRTTSSGAPDEDLDDDSDHRIDVTCLSTTAPSTAYLDGTGATPGASGSSPPPPASNSASSASSAPPPVPTVTFRALYRYATPCDRGLLALGCAMAIVNGVLYPLMALLFGRAISSFRPLDMAAIETVALWYLAIALGLFISEYAAHLCFQVTAERQMHALRIHYFRHVVYKDIAWFDVHPDGTAITSHLNGTTVKIKDGMGVKLGEVLRCVAQFVTGYAIGFATHWGVSIVMAAIMPFMAVCLSWIIKTLRAKAIFSQRKYAEAGAIAEETLKAMRTVLSFNGEHVAVQRYEEKAKSAEIENIKLARVLSIILGFFFGTVWVTYAVGLWYGGSLVSNRETTPQTVFSAFYGILIGTISLAQISPNLAAVVVAKASAASLYKVLDDPSATNAEREEQGLVPNECRGEIDVRNVDFAYPSRSDTVILKDYSLAVGAGETVALVGPSGGGKSTLIALLQRFYEPRAGSIHLDGHDIRMLQVKWLRRQIGVVSQEPVLFATTIFDNIVAALSETEDDTSVLKKRVEAAAKLAHAHDFISALPQGYNTFVGEKGVALSGGQKQRIAIARALVREPRILVLDEATSALDTESEAAIQDALNSIIDTTARTTIIIAHRLSTIRRADRVCVVEGGVIVESGTHEQLMSLPDGKFQQLVLNSHGDPYMTQRDASLMWRDSWSGMLSSGRRSSLKLISTRSIGSDLKRRSELARLGRIQDKDDIMIRERASTIESAIQKTRKGEQPSTGPQSKVSLWRLMKHNQPERFYLLAGLSAAILNGLSFPASAVLLSAIISTMVNKFAAYQATLNSAFLDDLYNETRLYAIIYIAGAVALVVISFVQSYSFKFMAEKLVSRLRGLHFRAICRQEIAFFDDAKHGTGALAAGLATLSTQAANLGGDSIGRVIQAATTFVAALMISFLLGSWMLSIVMCVVFPLLILSNMIRTSSLKDGSQQCNDDDMDRANIIAAESVTHIRTVAAFGLEKKMVDEFRQLSMKPMTQTGREANANGLALGFSSFITFAVYALVFWSGGLLVRQHKITFAELIRSLMAIMLSANGIGQATAHLTDVDAAKRAAVHIFTLEDQRSKIDPFDLDGLVPSEPTRGKLEFKDVSFAYPTRRSTMVLNGLRLRIDPGQVVALCGPSGGGKSTIIALLERFYDPLHGSIMLDGTPLESLNVRWLRSQIGLIAQEPVLFAGTIRENILYGRRGQEGEHETSLEELQRVAQVANAHEFISSLPDGYDTSLGANADQLSGGQKQRIAIARAIIKDPSILLLDEATSALDVDSEQIVQDALERVIKMKKRTTLIIAHRMRTIRNADKICVVSGGRIAEEGTHDELLQLDGAYAKLVGNSMDSRFSMMDRPSYMSTRESTS